jgi:hypothetical protein
MYNLTKVLDKCSADVIQFRRNVDGDAMLNGGPLVISGFQEWRWPGFDLSALEKELQMLLPYLAEDRGSLNNKSLASFIFFTIRIL